LVKKTPSGNPGCRKQEFFGSKKLFSPNWKMNANVGWRHCARTERVGWFRKFREGNKHANKETNKTHTQTNTNTWVREERDRKKHGEKGRQIDGETKRQTRM
jgi:hypothetical protein